MKCANETCEELGKSKCAACGLVSYCGQICQKTHWNAHKSFCKLNRKDSSNKGSTVVLTPSSTVSTSPISTQSQQLVEQQKMQSQSQPQIAINQAIQKRLHAIKMKTQISFQNGDFNGSVKNGQEALEVAKELPEPVQSIESIQILLNLNHSKIIAKVLIF